MIRGSHPLSTTDPGGPRPPRRWLRLSVTVVLVIAFVSPAPLMAVQRRADQLFGTLLLGNDSYTVDELWLRVRRADGSGQSDLDHQVQDVSGSAGALFEFVPVEVAKALGISDSVLRGEGFQIRLKIGSARKGSDNCPTFSVRYDQGWKWAKGGSPRSSDFKTIPPGFTLVFRATKNGSGNAKCEYVQMDQGQLTGL